MSKRVLVTGASGHIGFHLCKRLKAEGCWVRGVDNQRHGEFYDELKVDEFQLRDLRYPTEALLAADSVKPFDAVFNLAADMGGIGYISGNRATISRNNTRINLSMLEAARLNNVGAFIFSSSACVYPVTNQDETDSPALAEDTAWPANPEPGYGLEKLYAEELCAYYREEFKLNTQVARFHNCAGPNGVYRGGREKAPAAACRKVIETPNNGTISIWGDGKQRRSFMYVEDCVEGLIRLWQNGFPHPINIGTSEDISITELHELASVIGGKTLKFEYDLTKPQGVRGRNSDNTLIKKVLGWEPSTPISTWLPIQYAWIEKQIRKNG